MFFDFGINLNKRCVTFDEILDIAKDSGLFNTDDEEEQETQVTCEDL